MRLSQFKERLPEAEPSKTHKNTFACCQVLWDINAVGQSRNNLKIGSHFYVLNVKVLISLTKGSMIRHSILSLRTYALRT